MQGVKYDSDKLDWSLVPIESMEKVIEVLMFGAKKYAPDNWKKVPNAERRYYNAAMRHLTAHQRGETLDIETGLSHLAHAACCLLFLLELPKVSISPLDVRPSYNGIP
jgi:hypothetical protein